MNDLCVEIGCNSINHVGEELCGDHVEVAGQGEDSSVLVLADGLGSGVKANILSILTSRIISTMIAEGLPLEECVKAIAATLPICSVRKVAYSTFTIIRLINNEVAEIICYDNPPVVLIRNGAPADLPGRDMIVGGKRCINPSCACRRGTFWWQSVTAAPMPVSAWHTISAGSSVTLPNMWQRPRWQAIMPRRSPPCW